MRILFMNNEKALLPEIGAYIKYFNQQENFQAVDSVDLPAEKNIEDYDVIWEFKGLGGVKKSDKILVHEYASLSTGLLPQLKNTLKTHFNPKPDLRIFLNESVQSGFGFKDNVPVLYRDMGIDERFIRQPLPDSQKEYEFVYVGALSKERDVERMIEGIIEKPIGKLCLIGHPDDDVFDKYKNHPDIEFTGKVPYDEVPEIASKACYGLNFMPDKYPFNLQTSTKLIEYLAMNLKVISTNYEWVRHFQKRHQTRFYTASYENFKLDMDAIKQFDYENQFDARNFLWENIFESAGVKERLLSLYQNK